jgi:hypothetical protein
LSRRPRYDNMIVVAVHELHCDSWHETVDAFKVALSAQFELPVGDRLAENQIDGVVPVCREEVRIRAINPSSHRDMGNDFDHWPF